LVGLDHETAIGPVHQVGRGVDLEAAEGGVDRPSVATVVAGAVQVIAIAEAGELTVVGVDGIAVSIEPDDLLA
jgi:hypothetical protein